MLLRGLDVLDLELAARMPITIDALGFSLAVRFDALEVRPTVFAAYEVSFHFDFFISGLLAL